MTKLLHKNVTFWHRFASNIIDFCLFSTFLILLYKSFIISHQKLTVVDWYSFLVMGLLINYSLFIMIPYFWNGRSLGQIILRIQILNTKPTKKILNILRTNVPSWGLYSLITLLFICGVMPYQIDFISSLKDISNFINDPNLPLNLRFIGRIIATLSGFWSIINLLNYCFILASKNRRGVYDRILGFRIVYIKHYTVSQKMDEIKLIPHQVKKTEIIFHEEEHE
ncbi:RDD family protein [Mycoplasma zalophidermidis]|uniref:RDD family protein n=2 Tax=Mycoplasma zalophidermidis TaxID=398174 RepID=A0ABS6DS37_9MOLU|nr:RDD family protein [Mycoplasma zalophidermidis]MBU4689747.1 RDD family protein [Mycoplasma zalophidermidis]MBU4693741.1 RDD family protein [Mycoplasma zalophidermidis]MCR8966622.1 RDD family protein [Mycoplasma zalophidermidis]